MSVKTHKSSKRSRCVSRELKDKHRLGVFFKPFTDALTKRAIGKFSNSTAVGPDGLTSLHLKFLGPLGLRYLTTLYNLSIAYMHIFPLFERKLTLSPSQNQGNTLTSAPVTAPSPFCPLPSKSSSASSYHT
jgi:hypothetical protein